MSLSAIATVAAKDELANCAATWKLVELRARGSVPP
jgi:hypothetical protein